MARTMSVKAGTSGKSAGSDLTAMVQKKAYELYEKRGKKPGYAMQDWLEAERIIKWQSRF